MRPALHHAGVPSWSSLLPAAQDNRATTVEQNQLRLPSSGGSRGGAQGGGGGAGGAPPPPPLEMTCGFPTQLVFCKKKRTMWFVGVEVEQETSAPRPKTNPGSAPEPA